MIAVAIAAFNTVGVVAEGSGEAFGKHAKPFVTLFFPRMKDAKLVLPATEQGRGGKGERRQCTSPRRASTSEARSAGV
jgi:hypothetical protein